MICRPRKSDSHPRRSSVHIVTVRHTAHAAVLVLAVKENLFPLLPSGSRGSPLIKILTNVLIFCQMSDILNRPCREVVGPYGQRYRSGHNGADSKSVWEQSHEGSNPSRCATSSEQSPLCSDDFLSKSSSAPLPCSSSPNRTRCAGLRFGFGPKPERGPILTAYCTTSRQSPLCSCSVLSEIAAPNFYLQNEQLCGIIQKLSKCRCSSMAECQLPKLNTRVRFPSPAPGENPPKSLCCKDFRRVFFFMLHHLTVLQTGEPAKNMPSVPPARDPVSSRHSGPTDTGFDFF